MQMLFKTITSRYINTSLTCNIRSGAIYNIKLNPIKWQNNIPLINWNYMFNACVEKWNILFTCFCMLVITIQTYSQHSGISTYIHTISYKHINPVSYHIVRVSHCRVNVRTVTYMHINPGCTMWYDCTITEQICVR